MNSTYEKKVLNETQYGKPDRQSYYDCIREMLVLENSRFVNDPGVIQFRDSLKQMNMTARVIMKKIRWLYSQFSYKVALKVYEVTLPEYHEVSKIVGMLRCAGVKKDDVTIKTVQIILRPLPNESSMEIVST